METEYEKLKKEGYTEEEIETKLGPMSRLSIDSSPMGQGRNDRSVTFTDKDGTVSRGSNIMVGYNRRNIQLPNGTYVGIEEFSRAMTKFLQEDAENKVIFCKKTGKRVNIGELVNGLREVAKSQTGLELHGTTDKMRGNAYEYSIKGESARRILLGKKIQLDCGQWVSEEELLNAMRDYVYLSAPDKTPPVPKPDSDQAGISPEPSSDKTGISTEPGSDKAGIEPEPNNIRVDNQEIEDVTTTEHVKKRRKARIAPIILATLLTATILLSMIGKRTDDIMATRTETTATARTAITEVVEYREDRYEEAINNIFNSVQGAAVGDTIAVPPGVIYFYASPNNDISKSRTGIIGETPERPAGEYEIFGVSVLDKSGERILDTEFEKETTIADVVQRACENQNIDLDQTSLRISLTNTGWIEMNDLVKKVLENEEITPDDVVTAYHSEQTYDAVQEDFTDSVTFETENGEVTIKVRNDDGSLVETGTVLEGSDGKLYRLDDVGVEQKDTVIPYVERTEEKRTFSVSNIVGNIKTAEVLATATALATALAAVYDKKREEEYEKSANEYENSNNTKFNKTVSSMVAPTTKTGLNNGNNENADTSEYTGGPRL